MKFIDSFVFGFLAELNDLNLAENSLSFINENGSITDPYKNFIHISRYARWVPDLNRRETWVETVSRLMNFMKDHLVLNYGYSPNAKIFDEVKEATTAQSAQHKEDLHQLGQSLQRSYDERINALRTIINTEVNSIKQNPTTPIEDLQGLYKRLKKASDILATFTTIF
jgi:hypothetical protein